MLDSTLITWILVIFGVIFIFAPMLYAQFLMIIKPHSQKTKNIIIGKGQDWRDKTHFLAAYGLAWADLIIWLPAIAVGSIGVLLGYHWGYIVWAISGAISVYISITLWFMEREYVYPSKGPWPYYTFYWGFFIYWGVAAVAYSIIRLVGIEI